MASREEIVEAAFKYIDENGIESFSMRKIAQELGIGTMSTYRYFASKDELIEAVRTKLRSMYDNAPIPGERWDDTLRRTVASIRAVDISHPNIWIAAHGYNNDCKPHSRRIYALHKDQGIPLEIYRPLWCAIEAYLVGFVGQEISARQATFEEIDPNDPDYEWMMIAENAYTDEAFSNGLEIIIRGTAQNAAPDPCEWYTPMDRSEWTWKE